MLPVVRRPAGACLVPWSLLWLPRAMVGNDNGEGQLGWLLDFVGGRFVAAGQR